MTASTSTQDQETLPDIVCPAKTSDAVAGLLMLGANTKDLDAEIDNKLIMPVNKPKQPDISKTSTMMSDTKEQHKCNKRKKRNQDHPESPK